jgi:raffinose/stachyose/melibiose transport system permease protein
MATVAERQTPPMEARTAGRKRPRGDEVNWPLTVILLVASLFVLVPLYFTIAMALKTSQDAVSGNGFSFPWPLNWSNFSDAWTLTNFPRAFTVSILIAAFTVLGEIVLCSLTAYAIARNWTRKLFRYSFYYLLAAMFIPFPVIALPQVKLTSIAHLDNPVGVTMLHILFGLGFNVLLYTAFLRSVPYELEESARMDGCSTWQTFWKLIFPLLAPMNATVGIFAFLASWNDFMLPSLITSNPNQQTLPVVQALFQTQFSSNYNISFASYLMAMLPTLVVYLFAQRWVMSGVTQGAIK